MELEGSLPCSQQPATGLNPDRDESSPHPPTIFPQDTVQYYPPSMPTSSELSFSFRFSDETCKQFSLPEVYYTSRGHEVDDGAIPPTTVNTHCHCTNVTISEFAAIIAWHITNILCTG